MTLIEILETREEALDVHQVAELLKVSERHIYELAANGSLPAFRVGKVIRFDSQDVADWLRKKRPVEERDTRRKPRERKNPSWNENMKRVNSADQIWRERVRCLEAALAIDNPADGNTIKGS